MSANNEEEIVINEDELVNDAILKLQKQLKLEPEPVSDSLDTVIVVDCLPVIGTDKIEKLKNVLKRTFDANAAVKIQAAQIRMPMNKDKKTLGYAFVELSSLDEVSRSLTKINGYRLDKKHVLVVNRFSDFDRLANVPDEYVPPEIPEYKPKDNLQWWLPDKREQYAIMYGSEVEVYWHEPIKPQPEQILKKSLKDLSIFVWSPHGSYLAVVARGRRVVLRAGANWASFQSFGHHGIDNVSFSPDEKYLTSCVSDKSPNAEKEFFTLWDIQSGKKLRSFPKGNFFKWSHDDKYFARMSENKISIYETPSCVLLEKKSLAIRGVNNFEWHPKKNVISIFIQGENNTPSFISLLEIPSRNEIYRKSLFSVKSCSMYWQSEGRYLCLQVDRFTKNKKNTVTSFEIFNFEGKIVTTEILLMKDQVKLFAWEPRGVRFGIIHGEQDAPVVNVSFYQMGKKKLDHKSTLEKRTAQKLFWSPRGSYLVIGGKNGSLEFYNAAMCETMNLSDHYMVSALQWDPTGRYVCTYVSAWKIQFENGYVIRTFKGDVVHKVLKDQFYDFQWRPRPPTLLSKEKEAEIRSNLKHYAAKYREEDAGLLGVIVDAKYKEQQRLLQEYADKMKHYREVYASQREERIRLRDGLLSDDENDYEEVESFEERVVDEQEEEIDA